MSSPKAYTRRHRDQADPTASDVPTGPIPLPPNDPDSLKASGDDTLLLDTFTVSDAWTLGTLLRHRLSQFSSTKPTLISISLANSSQVIFQCAVGSGTVPDNEVWVARKRATVLRWGCSTWFMHCKFRGDEELFGRKYGMDGATAARYAIHGGGVPVRVKGVEGVVAVVVVSGLKQQEDHGVVMEAVRGWWREVE